MHHSLGGGELMLSAKGHEHGAAANGGVKALTEAPFGADIQILRQFQIAFFEVPHLLL